jgi:4'-phosphopantetheinyl transferase
MHNVIFQIEKIPESFNEPRYLPVLNREELYRYKSFSNELKKRQFLFSRFLLKNKLFEVTGINADEMFFETGEHGKPYLKGIRTFFNISHSENYVGYMIAKKEVGFDIQVQRPFSNIDDLIQKVGHPNEIVYLLSHPEKESLFLKLWSLKEAYSKCLSLGFQVKFKSIDFSHLLENPFTETQTLEIEGHTYEVLFKVLERSSHIFVSAFKRIT